LKTRRALLLASLTLAPLAASAAEVWVAGATEKIRPDAQPRASTEASLTAARNEFEAFQVVVRGPATRVAVEAAPLVSPAGAIEDVKLFREELIDVRQPSAVDGGTGRWPDALVPAVDDVVGEARNAFPFDVPAGESRAVWVEYRVPQDAASAVYRGSLKVASAEGEAVVPVTLSVWDFALPSTSSLKTHFGLAYGLVARGHGVSGDADATLRAQYAQLGLDHRISLSGVADDGNHRDLAHFDRFYGPLVAGTAPTRLPGARLTTVKFIGNTSSVDEHRSWAQHAKAQGWMDRLFQYTCDEPPLTCAWGDIAGRTAAARGADPEFRTLVTTQVWDAEAHGVAGDIDVMVPVVNFMDDKPGAANAGDQRARYDGFLAQPRKELWMYQSCMSHGCGGTVNMGSPSESDRYFTGWPTYMIDASAVRNRAMEWISFLEGATGELYWESAFAFARGTGAWTNQWDFSGNGDGTLFYPGTPARIGGKSHIPVASIRLKMIREGMEDYEYLRALADAGDPEGARQIARQLFSSAYATEVDPGALMAAREAIALRILQLSGKAPPAGTAGAAAGGGCGSAGGLGGGALLALPALLLMALARRRATAAGPVAG
jgi:glycosyl hydrolase family 123